MKKYYFFLLLVFMYLSSCTETMDVHLGKGYYLADYGVRTSLCNSDDIVVLMGGVVDYSHNKDFILIYRKVDEQVHQSFNDHYMSYLLYGGDTIQYWIIDKRSSKVYGPLKKNNYTEIRSQLNIPAKLVVDTVPYWVARK